LRAPTDWQVMPATE